jgi:hypothetical protein
MIAYGFIVDLDKLKGKKRDKFCHFMDRETDLEFITAYSVGAYEPNMAVVGVTVDVTNFLFNPVPLRKLDMQMPDTDKFRVDSFDLKTVSEWIECFVTSEPELIVFDPTDD